MASDNKEREAIERTARRIKEQNEQMGKSGATYQDALRQAQDVARDYDKNREKA